MRELQFKPREMALDYTTSVDAQEENRNKETALAQLQSMGILTIINGAWVFDGEKFKLMGIEGIRQRKHIFSTDFLAALNGMSAYDKKYLDSSEDSQREPQTVVALPERLSGLEEFYKSKESNSILQPWEIVSSSNSLYKPISLKSGESISVGELKLAALLLRDLRARRNEDGRLEIYDGEKYQIFNTALFRRITGFNPSSGKEGKIKTLYHSGLGFVRENLPRLLAAGIFQRQDFKVQGGSTTAEIYNVNERSFNSKAPFVNFTTSPGHSAKYYVGREKLVGTKESIDFEKMRIRLLDSATAGIVEDRHGKKILRYTFSLLTDKEIETKQDKLLRRGVYKKDLPNNVVVNANEMKARISKYNITDYIPQHNGETAKGYAERISRLSDVAFVSQIFQNFFSEIGIGVHKLPWSEQLVLASSILEEKDKAKLAAFARNYGINGLRTFLSLDFDPSLGQKIFKLADSLDKENAIRLFQTYCKVLDEAKYSVQALSEQSRNDFRQADLSEEFVYSSLLSRSKDLLLEAAMLNESNPEANKTELVNKLISELQAERPQERVVRSEFKTIAALLKKGEIELSLFEQQQALVFSELLKDPEKRAMTLRVLSRMGKLEPVPEIHWRVDRNMEEYNRRFGIDLVGFLKEKAKQKPNQKLLEIGPGSGKSKEERAQAGLGNLYNEFALSDKIYYPLAPVIEKLIDFEKLQSALGLEVASEDRKKIADFIYKAIVITKGETAKNNFSYNSAYQKAIAADINALKSILPEIQVNLKLAKVVPEQTSVREELGNTSYPYKIETAKQSQEFQKAKSVLEKNLIDYLRKDWQEADYHQFIQAFPANVMIADLQDIKRLSPDQLDVELATRSTVFASGESYKEFLNNLLDRMAPQGVMIDDSIRDLDGYYYRFYELQSSLETKTEPFEALIVLGPGFEGQDFRQDKVPLAMIVTKQGSSRNLAEKYQLSGFEIKTLGELMLDEEYLKSLDTTGRTARRAKEALEAA